MEVRKFWVVKCKSTSFAKHAVSTREKFVLGSSTLPMSKILDRSKQSNLNAEKSIFERCITIF